MGIPGNSSDALSLDEIDLSAFRQSGEYQFDLVVIGSGPAGQKAAITAAKHGKRVALVERDPMAGGVCLNTGTIPSKSLREAVVFLTGYRQRGYYGDEFRLKDRIQVSDLLARTNHVIRLERAVVNNTLVENGVFRLVGSGRIAGPHEVLVDNGGEPTRITARAILIATGTQPRRPPEVPFDDANVIDSDSVFGVSNQLHPLPDSIIVLGAGIIGIEYATMFAALNIPTTVVDPRLNPLHFVDTEVVELLYESLRRRGVRLLFGEEYEEIQIVGEPGAPEARVRVVLRGGKSIQADELLFALGRVPATKGLGLEDVGVACSPRGHIEVNEFLQSNVPSIYAAGDVIGFPSLASTSAEQGRVAALHAMDLPVSWNAESLPFGIYTIPEMSLIGKTEDDLIVDKTPYVVGTALWRDTARGKILGDLTGALKLVFHRETHALLGVHIIGEGATELLHIGQAVMHFSGGIEYFCDTVFNYPTLAEAYKTAAFNALNRLEGRAIHTARLLEQIEQRTSPTEWVQWS